MKWEYKCVGFNLTGLETKLNALGQEGWELVSLHKTGIVLDVLLAIFKRPHD